jgi:pSer/pThr/pTyr-binding forkhead associated (FHA) protein
VPRGVELKIEILQNGVVVETRDFIDGSYKIGRAKECDICIKSARVSKQHALLVVKGNKAAIVDVGSSNGIFVNGVLVRKQRLETNDVADIGDYQIRVGRSGPSRRQEPNTSGIGIEGNLATNLDMQAAPGAAPAVELTPQEKLAIVMEEKVFQPFFNLLKVYDWRWILGCTLLITMILSVVFSVVPIVDWGKGITTKEALQRAHSVLTQVVRENYRVLTKTNDFTRLTVEAAEKAEGMLLTYIVDTRTGNILAPAKYYNNSIKDESGGSDIYAQLAIKRVLEGKDEQVTVDKGKDTYIVAQPIPFYDSESQANTEEKSLPVPAVIALAYFKVPDSINSTFEPLSIACLISVLLSLSAFLLISKMVAYPVVQINEQLDSALKGDNIPITCDWRFPELQALATVVNFTVSKMKQATGGGMGLQAAEDIEAADESYVQAIQGVDFGSSDALLVLDKDKKVRYVGRALEELIGMRSQYAIGQNISDACRDQSFAGTAIDMAESVIKTLGENQNAQLEVNGISRNIVAVPHRNVAGEIRFILITVKLGA